MNRAVWFTTVALACLIGCEKPSAPSPATSNTSGNATESSASKLTELKKVDVKVGLKEESDDPGAQSGDQLTMTYTGTLANGTVFDSNDKPDGKPFTFALGGGSVIKGWDEGLVGMYEGGERKLSIPAKLAYGDKAMGDKIAPNSDLYFDVKLTHLLRAKDKDTVLRTIKKAGSGPALKKGDTAVITFTGALFGDDTPFDDHSDLKKEFTFKVGAGEVYPGFDVGVVGMRQGGEITLRLPPGTGPMGAGIPPGSTTVYDIKLREIKH